MHTCNTNDSEIELATSPCTRGHEMKKPFTHPVPYRLCWLIAGHDHSKCTFQTFRKCTKQLGFPSSLKAGNLDRDRDGGGVSH